LELGYSDPEKADLKRALARDLGRITSSSAEHLEIGGDERLDDLIIAIAEKKIESHGLELRSSLAR